MDTFYPSDSGSGHILCGAPQFRISFKSPFLLQEQPLCGWSVLGMQWRRSVRMHMRLCLGGVNKLLCGHVSVGIRPKLEWMTSSLWLHTEPPPPQHTHTNTQKGFCSDTIHVGITFENVQCLPPKLRIKKKRSKDKCDIFFFDTSSNQVALFLKS